MKHILLLFTAVLFLNSCASRKDIIYLQDIDAHDVKTIAYQESTIQPNDILKITIESLSAEAALPYNKSMSQGITQTRSIELMQLEGYVVSLTNTVRVPILGEISTKDKTTKELAQIISDLLISGNHLSDARVDVRLLNAKITILGEVRSPGTYTYMDQNMTLLQALGLAGDLTISGERKDVLMTREVDGVRKVTHIDLTSAKFMNSEYYFIKPNDMIVVNPNEPKVKSSGFIGNVGTVATVISLALSITILLTR